MPIAPSEVKVILDQVKALVEQLEGLRARAEQEELATGRFGAPAPRLTRKA